MGISGFTFIKNGLSLGYPIKESIQSIAPLCSEVIINVGFDDPNLQEDDGTYTFLRDTFPEDKFKFLKSYWSPEMCSGGEVLAEQTNIALAHCKGPFCHYIQADEIVHEHDYAFVEDALRKMERSQHIDGVLYNYLHFFGNIDVIKFTRNIYRREVRLIRNGVNLQSFKDAQGFRYKNGEKIRATLSPLRIFHYGWARKEQIMSRKINAMNKLYHGDSVKEGTFGYSRVWGLRKFTQEHPALMREWLEQNKNDVDVMKLKLEWQKNTLGLMLSDLFERCTGIRPFEFKNYRIVKE